MSTLPQYGLNQAAPGSRHGKIAGEVSRRSILAGAMATSAIVAVGSIDNPAYAQSADSDPDMMAFLVLSAALTGLKVVNLAPEFTGNDKQGKAVPILEADPGVDPFNIKKDYFQFINLRDPAGFGKLLQIARDNHKPESVPDIIKAVNDDDDAKYLARSIVLLWYLGSWYEPANLKKASPSGDLIFSHVVSAKAYTQGRVWQIAQAHPMGYSNLQFGYWAREPTDPSDPKKGSLDFITATIP
jgi:hypothetical protein